MSFQIECPFCVVHLSYEFWNFFCVLFIDIFCELSFVYFKVLCILHICVLFVYLALCCSLCLDLFVLARGLPCGPHPPTPSERQYAILYLGKPLHKKSTVQTVFVRKGGRKPCPNGMWEFFSEYKPLLRHLICTIFHHYIS